MASTKVDGIDNGMVENVIIFRGCHSVARSVQSLGRIRLPRQNFEDATFDVFDTGYNPTPPGDANGNVNYIKQAGVVPPGTTDHVLQDFYSSLLHTVGYRQFIEHKGCYRKYMFAACGITALDCNKCSNCRMNHETVAAASAATAAVSRELANKQYVREQLKVMRDRCYACKKSSCDGSIAMCLGKERSRYCFGCQALSVKDNFHKSCPAKQLPTKQQSCPYCLLALDQAIPETGTLQDHKPNQCIFKDRIKRVLLYQVQHCEDKGMSAKKLLQPCLINNDIWYKVMGENMRLITSLEEDFRDSDDL